MVRIALLTWVLVSLPLSVALGHMLRTRRMGSTPHGRLSAHDVATMVSRRGYRAH